MNQFQRAVLAIIVAVLLAGAWFFRWEITPVSSGESAGRAYMLNRWTGTLFYMVSFDRSKVETAK